MYLVDIVYYSGVWCVHTESEIKIPSRWRIPTIVSVSVVAFVAVVLVVLLPLRHHIQLAVKTRRRTKPDSEGNSNPLRCTYYEIKVVAKLANGYVTGPIYIFTTGFKSNPSCPDYKHVINLITRFSKLQLNTARNLA